MPEVNFRSAAEAARQLVRQKIDLQSLQAVLDSLAGDSNLVSELQQRIDTARGQVTAAEELRDQEVAATNERVAKAKADAETAIAGFKADEATAKAAASAAAKRRDGLQAEVVALEAKAESIRATLAGVRV